MKSSSVSAGRAKRKGLVAREIGQTVDIKPKKSTNTCHPENSTGWTNGGLEEPVEKNITV